MSFEKGDSVRLDDKHSDFDGEVGEVEKISETMFGGELYTVRFEDGEESGLDEKMLSAVEE